MDAAVLDAWLAELSKALVGRVLGKARSVAPHAVAFELAHERSRRLWLDASRRAAGLYLVERAETAALEDESEVPGRDRHALLLLRKHAVGRRVVALRRVAGSSSVLVDAGTLQLALRLSGTPALTVVLDGAAVATIGEGAPAWPLPADAAEAPPGSATPAVQLPGAWEDCRDRDLAAIDAVRLGGASTGLRPATWRDATAVYLVARRRGARFEAAQKATLVEARREIRRLERLEANLTQDEAGLPDAESLRRKGEALLASPRGAPGGASEARVPDPYDAARELTIALDPRLSLAGNADKLFAKARRLDRARSHVAVRLAETRRALEESRARESRAESASDVADLEVRVAPEAAGGASGTRHYLTGAGLSMLVGRGARENHHLTFSVARPEDLWLHARDVPGAHVVVRDNEGRAGADDIREAAEVAAFFSDARQEARVDVHVTRRKHVRAAKGGPGRVHVFHSDTIRVAPRDPEGRLRRR